MHQIIGYFHGRQHNRRKLNIVNIYKIVPGSQKQGDTTEILSKMKGLGASLLSTGQVSILLHQTQNSVQTYVLCESSRASDNFVKDLARAVGGVAELVPSDGSPNVDGGLTSAGIVELIANTPFITEAIVPADNRPSRPTQQGTNILELAERARSSLSVGSWLCVTARAATKREVKQVQQWYKFHIPDRSTHHTQDRGQLAFSIYAGAQDEDDAAVAVESCANAMSGFDLDIKVKKVKPSMYAEAISLLIAVAGVAGYFETHFIESLVLTVIGVVAAALFYRGIITTKKNKMVQQLTNGIIPPPATKLIPTKKARSEKVREKDGVVFPARSGDWPMFANVIVGSGTLVFPLAAPFSSQTAESGQTVSHGVPTALLTAGIGPIVGVDPDTQSYIYLPASSLPGNGVGMFGLPGTGKTQLMQTIFGWLILQRVEKKKMFARNGLFVFETKGEATSWIKWIGEFGDACVNVKINDPSTPAIDVYHLGETARKRAEAFVDVMKAGFGADDIQFASTGILVSLMTATFAFPVENIMPMLFNDLDPNPVMAAFILCGGLNDQSGLDLHSALVQWNATHPSEEQNRALTELGTIFGEKVTPSNRDSKTSAPRSKLAVLANNLGAFFATARPRFTMQYAVENHWITLIDYGSSASMGDLARSTITGMLFDHLRKTIENTCSSWQAEGRYSSIFIDEVAAIPTATREPSISWIRDQGRSYGVVPYLAAQSPAQLSPKLVGTLTSLGTFFALSQRDADAVRVITNALSLYGGWSAEEVASLPFYYAIMRSTFREQTQQAALVKLLLWDGTEAAAGRSPIDYREELTGD